MNFQIKTENFTGPLDLLLQLIEQEKLDITQVNLAKIADQYFHYVEKIARAEVEHAAEFLVIASQLLLIKSRVLLPEMALTEEEEEETLDLEERLKEYKRFKEIAARLKEIAVRKERAFERQVSFNQNQFSLFSPPQDVSADQLKIVFSQILKRMPTEEKVGEELLEKTITLEEKMEQIQNLLSARKEILFIETLSDSKSRLELVVTFLAILELIKRQIVRVIQAQLFEPIKIVPVNQ
jgi:segregation and condensation protein A